MTYFTYKNARGKRGVGVYSGSTYLGQVFIKTNWKSRLTMGPNTDLFCATRLDGDALPEMFRSRHDAAEALYEVSDAATAGGPNVGVTPQPPPTTPAEGLMRAPTSSGDLPTT